MKDQGDRGMVSELCIVYPHNYVTQIRRVRKRERERDFRTGEVNPSRVRVSDSDVDAFAFSWKTGGQCDLRLWLTGSSLPAFSHSQNDQTGIIFLLAAPPKRDEHVVMK